MSARPNVLFFSQSSSVQVFYELIQELSQQGKLGRAGLYVTDSRTFKAFQARFAPLDTSLRILKEWEIVKSGLNRELDLGFLKQKEAEFGDPFFWNTLIADRRIYHGAKSTFTQSYRPRFTHYEMLSILQEAIRQVEALFDDVRPGCVIFQQCLSVGDYLAYLIAKKRGIPLLNLRPTRVHNYLFAGESIFEPSAHLGNVYQALLKFGIAGPLKEVAVSHLRKVQTQNALYEGVVLPSRKPPKKPDPTRNFKKEVRTILGVLKGEFQFRFGELRWDNSVQGILEPFLHARVFKPLRAWFQNLVLQKRYAKIEGDYAFYPLHTEPEVTLSIYSRTYLNQIEAVRLISRNLPVGMKLLVKDHPWSVGRRGLGYYRKLLAIPNVELVDPSVSSRALIQGARLVTVLAGSIGLEAIQLKKPVIALGHTPYEHLPKSMFRYVDRPDRLGLEIADLMVSYQYQEDAIVAYLAAVVRESVSIDFYTKLLGRTEGHAFVSAQDEQALRQAQLKILAEYVSSKFGGLKPAGLHPPADSCLG